MTSSGNNALTYGIAGAGALIAGALAFHYISTKTSVSSPVFEEVEALGAPQRQANGFLPFNYYKDLFMIISKHSKQNFSEEKKELSTKRRAALKSGIMSQYKEIVKETITKEEEAFGNLLAEAMDHIGLNEQEFMQMHQTYMSNPQT